MMDLQFSSRTYAGGAMSSMAVVGSAVAKATTIAADFAPVPYLGPAVGLVIGILRLCENVRTNK
jgi:hypothetical protein